MCSREVVREKSKKKSCGHWKQISLKGSVKKATKKEDTIGHRIKMREAKKKYLPLDLALIMTIIEAWHRLGIHLMNGQ